MSGKMKLIIIAGVMIVGGLLAVTFGDTRGQEPSLVCVPEGTLSSGFVDNEQDGCPVSIESYNEHSEWRSQAQPVRGVGVIVAALGVLLLIGVGIKAAATKSRPASAGSAESEE